MIQRPRLCRNCSHCKTVSVGYVSSRSWCKLTGNGYAGKALGVNPWLNTPHPKCPLNIKEEEYEENSNVV